jgi:Protein of unknown function (DUF1592)/Protein of unknown function (DUF1588)/Protein of unknown function (DUF1585)
MPSLVIVRGFVPIVMAVLIGMLVAGLGGGCGDRSLSAGAPTDGAAPPVVSLHPDAAPVDAQQPSNQTSVDAIPGPTPDVAVPKPAQISLDEAARRVAAFLWNEAPDASLLSPDHLGHAATLDDLPSVVAAMLDDPRAAVGIGAFYRWWLDLPELTTLSKDPSLFPEFTPELRADMAKETETFGVNVTLNETFVTLMTADFSFINGRLAELYGVSGVVGDDLRQVSLPTGERAGLLTQAALQALGSRATRTSPAHRGTYVDERFFCQSIPPMPPNVPGLDPVPPGVTVRQQEEASTGVSSTCQVCHAFTDPLGFPFEGFDAIGRTRTSDDGAPVDTSSQHVRFPRMNGQWFDIGSVNGPVELAKAVAFDPGAQDCFARKWLSFALGRDLRDSDEMSAVTVAYDFEQGLNLKQLVSVVLLSPSFLAP